MGELDEQIGWAFETKAIHVGQAPDAATGAVVTPISLSTTFAQQGVGGHLGYEYSRSGNPTRSALEACVASLEGADHGLAFASGLAAEDNVLRLLAPGQRVLLGCARRADTLPPVQLRRGAMPAPRASVRSVRPETTRH